MYFDQVNGNEHPLREGILSTLNERGDFMNNETARSRKAVYWLYLLLLIPFIATLWPPFYNSLTPYWLGIPYFYWYQFLWILLSAAITGVVYFFTRDQ